MVWTELSASEIFFEFKQSTQQYFRSDLAFRPVDDSFKFEKMIFDKPSSEILEIAMSIYFTNF